MWGRKYHKVSQNSTPKAQLWFIKIQWAKGLLSNMFNLWIYKHHQISLEQNITDWCQGHITVSSSVFRFQINLFTAARHWAVAGFRKLHPRLCLLFLPVCKDPWKQLCPQLLLHSGCSQVSRSEEIVFIAVGYRREEGEGGMWWAIKPSSWASASWLTGWHVQLTGASVTIRAPTVASR